MTEKTYDVVVIGAGSGGLTAAVGARKIGKSVLLVEREHMGGECTNSGCIPSKALLHYAKAYATAKRVSGENAQNEAYRKEAFSYVRRVRATVLAEEQPEDLAKLGIDVVMGEAVFRDRCSVTVGERVYRYRRAIIATGSKPRTIKVQGLHDADVLTNETLFELEEIPKRTLIIGSGPVGMEMGQALSMLGSEVTIATIDPELGRLEDPAIRPYLQKAFAHSGIRTITNAYITHVEEHEKVAVFDIKSQDGQVEREERAAFDKTLIAVGRVPNLPKGLAGAGIKADDRSILIDSQHRTSNKYVYAIGDVAQRLKFTHTADDSARQVITRIASRGWLRVNRRKAVPKVTYTQPEIAQVGLSWEAACRRYDAQELMRLEVPFTENDRAKTDSATDGLLVVFARRLGGSVVGAHFIGPRAGELISVFALAIDQKISLWRLRSIIFAYPTYALIIKKAADRFFAQQIGDLRRDLGRLAKTHALKLIALTVWAALLFLVYTYRSAYGMGTTDTALMVFDFVSMTAWGPLLYILFYTVRPLTFFPATVLTILSGVFFGFGGGFAFTIIAASISASVAYLVGRFFGTGFRLEDSSIGTWVTALRTNSFESTLVMRLIFLPFDGVSYLAGILKISYLPFVFATFIGTLLGIATFVSIGASLSVEEFRQNGFTTDVVDGRFLLLSAVIFVMSLVLSRFIKRWRAVSD